MSVNPTAVTGRPRIAPARSTLGAAAPAGGAVVTLASSNLNAATVPASVTVAAGATTKTFAVTHQCGDGPDGRDHHGHLQRRGQDRDADGESGAAALVGVSVNPTAVTGGAAAPARHAHERGAGGRRGRGADEQQHQCGDGAGLVTVAQGRQSKTFVVTTSTGGRSRRVVTITATYSGVARTATLTVNPPAL